MPRVLVALATVAVTYFSASSAAHSQIIWSGYDFSFSKANLVDPTFPENQDRITENVWLTRQSQQGIYNIEQEASWDLDSPIDTEWATYINNPGETIAATNFDELTFEPWIAAYGGVGGMDLDFRLLGGDAVVHLITDDIYLDLRFTSWTRGGGGGFSYVRAMEPPVPEGDGDYNEDGIVDAADYVVWQKTLTQSAVPAGSGADGDGDGTVDPGDYDFWLQRFGEIVPAGGGGAAFAVPEPHAATLAVLIIVLWGTIFRLR